MPADDGNKPENLATAVTEVTERVTVLIREEIELAKAEVNEKIKSLRVGAAIVAVVGAILFFALIVLLELLAWVFDAIFTNSAGDIWVGFLITLVLVMVLSAGLGLVAYRKLKVGAPIPKLAIDEAKKIRETVTSKPEA